MNPKFVVAFTISFFFFFFFFLICQTGGVKFSNPSRRDLHQLNKPTMKTITTKYGDIIDCVDIHKQPSLDHPLLQNHTIQMKPSLIPKASSSTNGSAHEDNYVQFEIEDGGCPEGSVPIRRIQEQDIERLRAYLKENPSALNPNSKFKRGWHFANVQTKRMHIPFQGGRGLLNLYNPFVSNQQHSDSLIYVSDGIFETHNCISAGWSVFPAVYGDNLVRLHSFWTADNYLKTGCIDMHCPGFIQVSKTITLGMVLKPISQYGGQQYQVPVAISHDEFSGNWWLIASMNVMVGYWPKEIFNGLRGYAERVGWGGRVYSPVGTLSPPMGSGYKPNEGSGKSCMIKELQFVRTKHGIYEDLNGLMLLNHADNPQCYDVKLLMDSQDRANILFGGPGGECGNYE